MLVRARRMLALDLDALVLSLHKPAPNLHILAPSHIQDTSFRSIVPSFSVLDPSLRMTGKEDVVAGVCDAMELRLCVLITDL